MEKPEDILPENVKKIIETLQTHGYEAYAVGGCVRDSVLGLNSSRLGYYNFCDASGNKNIV